MSFPERLSVPEVVTVNSCESGQNYDVFIGLPPAYLAENGVLVHEIPNQPHIVPVDTFVLRELNKPPLVQENDVNVLFMHGCFLNRRWVPGDPALQARGITVPGIVDDFEAARPAMPIDVLYVCSTELATASLLNTPKFYSHSRPRVFNRDGAATGMGIRTIQGRVHADMFVNHRDDVTYLPWLAMKRGRPSMVRIRNPDQV